MTARAYAGLVYARALEHGATVEEAEEAARRTYARACLAGRFGA